jgi:hypothetical protein
MAGAGLRVFVEATAAGMRAALMDRGETSQSWRLGANRETGPPLVARARDAVRVILQRSIVDT